MHREVIRPADHDKLVSAFNQVIATLFDLCDHRVTPHLPFNIADRATCNSALLRCFGGKEVVEERRVALR